MSTSGVPETGEEALPFRARIGRWRREAFAWWGKQWRAIRPGPEATRGAVWGTLVSAALGVVIAGLYVRTGFGYAFDFLLAIVVAAIAIPLVALLVALLLVIARKLPPMATGWIVGSCAIVMLVWFPPELGIPMAVVMGVAEGILGATIATFVAGGFREAAPSKKVVVGILCLLALSVNGYVGWLLVHEGTMEKILKWRPPVGLMPAKLPLPNPSLNGSCRVDHLFYGSGTDIRRPEYGSSVAIKTHSVDASLFFKDFDGWKRWTRKKYWGFDIDKLPLNARVWYPEGPGPFPLVLIVHGNHEMSQFSDPGYAYLGELLASRGFIMASVDENFLNSGLFHDPPKQQPVRGWMLLEHLKLWCQWNQTKGNLFYGKVDFNRIALMGHSRGGEAAATAAVFNRMQYDPDDANIRFDYNFPIQAVVAIAPADGQYKPAGQPRWVEDVSYLTLQGAHDADVSSFMGSRQWDHVRYSQPGPWFKAEIYAYRANHGQFNTAWGRTDAGEPLSWLLNLKPLLPGDEQRKISKAYISAFLEATLKDRSEYLPLFEDWRTGRDWLPDTIYENRYQQASYIDVASFDEDADLTTTTAPGGHITGENLSIWREAPIPWRSGDRGYNGVFLGWNRADKAPVPSYSIALPDGANSTWQIGPDSTIELSVAALDEDAPLPGKKKDDKKSDDSKKKEDRESPDFTVELVASDGSSATAVVSRFAAVPPPLTEKFTKLGWLESQGYEKETEPVFQTVRIPLSAFKGNRSKPFDPSDLHIVRLKFDRTPMSVVCISGLGFGRQ
jgi:dienelactone hydrolase